MEDINRLIDELTATLEDNNAKIKMLMDENRRLKSQLNNSGDAYSVLLEFNRTYTVNANSMEEAEDKALKMWESEEFVPDFITTQKLS